MLLVQSTPGSYLFARGGCGSFRRREEAGKCSEGLAALKHSGLRQDAFFLQHNIIEAITQHTSSINPHWEEVYSGRSRGDGSIIKLHALRDATQWQREKAVFLT